MPGGENTIQDIAMAKTRIPWLVVSGFGRHLKATPQLLTVQYRGEEQTYPVHGIRHLLILGGHHLHTSVISHLLRSGCNISFFDADATHLGTLRPPGMSGDRQIRDLQVNAPVYASAVEIARASMKSRLILMEKTQEEFKIPLFYEGEHEFLHQALGELEFLIKLEEIRRLHRLVSDMYYEVMARTLPAELGFRRRMERPHRDPVNAMLSLGYAMLFGLCSVSVVGADLDPDIGILRYGEKSLVYDLIDALKPAMVDRVVYSIASDGLSSRDYDCGTVRCNLNEALTRRLTAELHASIDQDQIDDAVLAYRSSLLEKKKFH